MNVRHDLVEKTPTVMTEILKGGIALVPATRILGTSWGKVTYAQVQ